MFQRTRHLFVSLGLLSLLLVSNGVRGATEDNDEKFIKFLSLEAETKALLLRGKTLEDAIEYLQYMDEHIRSLQQSLVENYDLIRDLEKKAHTDALTGLRNRHALEIERRQAELYEGSYYVVAMDIDHFKRINDFFGHDVGDNVLRRFGRILLGTLRDRDEIREIIRTGGEEFLLALGNIDREDVKKVVERLQREIREEAFLNGVEITISVGVVMRRKDETYSQLLKRADQTLYHAKKTRDTIVWDDQLQGCSSILR